MCKLEIEEVTVTIIKGVSIVEIILNTTGVEMLCIAV